MMMMMMMIIIIIIKNVIVYIAIVYDVFYFDFHSKQMGSVRF